MEEEKKKKELEEYGIVIDYLPTGKSSSPSPIPIVQLVGDKFFTLLEASVKKEVKIGDKVYIGKENRNKIEKIKGKIEYKDLTLTAQNELPNAISKIIDENEKRFVDFFNKAGPLNIRQHSLELLPGIGKKHLNQILEEREKKEFSSLSEINERIPLLPNAKRVIIERIIEELSTPQRYYLFVRK
jgi:putative nucleotide binding protein